MQNYSVLEYIYQSNIILFYGLFEYIGNLNNPNFYSNYEPSLFELFIWPFLFFLVMFLLFGIIGTFLKNKIQLKQIGNWKFLFLYIFPWMFWGIIWSPIVFGLLHKKIDKNFFIHSIISVVVYLFVAGFFLIVLEI